MTAQEWLLASGFALAACAHSGHPASDVAPPSSSNASGAQGGDASPAANDADASAGPTAGPVEAGAPAAAGTASAPLAVESTGPSYPAASLKETFEKNEAKLLACYEPGRKRNPKLRGRVIVKFAIGSGGKPSFAEDQGSNLEDPAVIACVVKTVKALHFPRPDEGSVTIVYPFIFHSSEPFLILPESAAPH